MSSYETVIYLSYCQSARVRSYVTIRSGSKIWCYLDVPGSASMSRDALFRAWDGLFADNIGLEFTRRARPGTIVLERGDTL